MKRLGRRAWFVNVGDVDVLASAESRGQAKSVVYYGWTNAGCNIKWNCLRVRRAPEHDEWARRQEHDAYADPAAIRG